ncbi:MAG: UDP-N-acetylmuramoyl-L-alanine--D-glutamate ligase [Candidatus Cloacimonetes bacterium]|nr:UDP-N-acetylmuramoyl-L-alanine--D-glutamate ligase [Candidatus Cloacimonadota bacterium]
MNLLGKTVGILGIARSGIAAAKKIQDLGGAAFLSDNKSYDELSFANEISSLFACEFGGHSERLLNCDLLVVSPGVPNNIPILQKAYNKNIEVISEIELGYRIKHSDSKIIAVTGSNGKSTTASLIHHIIKSAGYNCILAGNIGDAFTKFEIEKPGIDFIVLEISSFQLELIEEFRPDIAVLLNITPDHLNRYDSFEDYALAKFNIFRNQTEKDIAIINSDDDMTAEFRDLIPANIKSFSLTKKTECYYNNIFISYETPHGFLYFKPEETKLLGKHNIANIMSSLLAVSSLRIDKNTLKNALNSFNPLQHRLEFVKTINGVKFYNDSKATNTDSVKYALESFNEPLRVIMGGSDKGEDFGVLIPYLKKHANKIYLIGETREKMINSFNDSIDFETFDTFETAIEKAFKDSSENEIVLLSPACASYDMFKNYEERGRIFKDYVNFLAATAGETQE